MIVEVKVVPRSSKTAVEKTGDNSLKVKLTAPPAEGKANEQLIELLSEELGVKKSAIRIIKGYKSKNKLVEISGEI